MTFKSFMHIALEEAKNAASRGEVPVGAVVVSKEGTILAQAGNRTREHNDPSAHAELLAIREACRVLGQDRLVGCDLYVTLEPCAMCAGALSHARVRRVYYGASDPKSGGVEVGARVFEHPQSHHKPEVISGLHEKACASLLTSFFEAQRTPK